MKAWDVIVVGTGMGGSTLGHALAKKGMRVLFLEKGNARSQESLAGEYLEDLVLNNERLSLNVSTNWQRAGRWRAFLKNFADSGPADSVVLGKGEGGSSALYGMAMERLFPSDFEPKKFHPGATESTLPDRWPVAYAEFEPYYALAEKLYRVHSDLPDPLKLRELRTPQYEPDASRFHWTSRTFFKAMQKKGLRLYTVPFACDYVEGCLFCQGFLCPKNCKNDSKKVALDPAVKEHGAQLMTDVEVVRVLVRHGVAEGVEVRRKDGSLERLLATKIVLAAGALVSPLILLNSATNELPEGLANSSGCVGRNLMRHLIDIYFLPSPFNLRKSRFSLKEFAWNDFYEVSGVKYGAFQPFGKFPSPESIFLDVQAEWMRDSSAFGRFVFPALRPWMRWGIQYLFGFSGIAAPILEDTPMWNNRVRGIQSTPTGDVIQVDYEMSAWDRQRLVEFRQMIRKALFPPYPFFLVKMAEKSKMIAHACGTIRFGDDPKTSALNRWNECHDVRNLYVADASFFPSSGGVNPSLTIAANALRIADRCADTFAIE